MVQSVKWHHHSSSVSGYELLFQPEVVRVYTSLLRESQNPSVLEAAAGAIQNLCAGRWTVSALFTQDAVADKLSLVMFSGEVCLNLNLNINPQHFVPVGLLLSLFCEVVECNRTCRTMTRSLPPCSPVWSVYPGHRASGEGASHDGGAAGPRQRPCGSGHVGSLEEPRHWQPQPRAARYDCVLLNVSAYLVMSPWLDLFTPVVI